MRAQSLVAYPGILTVESAVLGDFTTVVPATDQLDRDIDVLWVTPKSTQLEVAVELAPPPAVALSRVIPLLNGVDHVPCFCAPAMPLSLLARYASSPIGSPLGTPPNVTVRADRAHRWRRHRLRRCKRLASTAASGPTEASLLWGNWSSSPPRIGEYSHADAAWWRP